MKYHYFSHNGQVLPTEQAVIPLGDIAYAYGFGVYETIRVDKSIIYFMQEHVRRLQQSADIIGLKHSFSNELIRDAIVGLIHKNQTETCNLKLMLIGGARAADATLYILCLNPFFPDRKLYSQGANTITRKTERPFPHAKSLNMLPSYLAYRQAKENDAYDALLVNRDGCITEGTRTNFFAIKGKTLISPPEDEILLGVMRAAVLKVAAQNGFKLQRHPIALAELENYDGAFLTSTSSKIMPVKAIDTHEFDEISSDLRELMQKTREYLESCEGVLA